MLPQELPWKKYSPRLDGPQFSCHSYRLFLYVVASGKDAASFQRLKLPTSRRTLWAKLTESCGEDY